MELLTIRETAQVLKVNPITVRRYIAGGRLPAVKVGKGVRVRREAVERLLTPVAPQTKRPLPTGRVLTYDDPLWQLVGSATDARPSDAAKKHEYLADAFSPVDP